MKDYEFTPVDYLVLTMQGLIIIVFIVFTIVVLNGEQVLECPSTKEVTEIRHIYHLVPDDTATMRGYK